jgi:aryl-alcohol dehydrogenase-like predicted oxidoreductase
MHAIASICLQLRAVADRHVIDGTTVSIANVATRWVLQQPAVAAVIVGLKPGRSQHAADNKRAFAFTLDAADLAAIDEALVVVKALPGDCGDEYR